MKANTLEGLIFYPRIIIKLFNPTIIGSFVVIVSIEKLKELRNYKIKFNYSKILNKTNIFLLSVPINILLICTLMSTKDLRFILSIFPSFCVLSGIFISKLKKYHWVNFIKYLFYL